MVKTQHQRSGIISNYIEMFDYTRRVLFRLFGTGVRKCPLCNYCGRFLASGYEPRLDARCPRCGGLERHRLLHLWLERHPESFVGKRILHFAPEELLGRFFRERGASYTGADVVAGKADIVLNVEDIDLADASVDLVICCHVLEHIDDRKALAELYRVLSPGGLAVLMFPIIEGWSKTFDEGDLPTPILSATERIRYFGQHDHLRYYGRDVRHRINAVGFVHTEFVAEEPDVSQYALTRGETIFLAQRPTDQEHRVSSESRCPAD